MIAIAGTQIDENRGNATMSTTLYRPDESIVRRPGRAEASFLEASTSSSARKITDRRQLLELLESMV